MFKGLSIALAATAAALALGEAAEAQDTGVDLNVGVSFFSEPDADAATGRISGLLTEHFGVEGEVDVDLGDDGFDAAWGLFGLASLPVSDEFGVIGRIGYANADDVPGDDGGVAIGAGGVWMLDSRNGVRFDYTRYDFGDDASAISVTYVRRLY